MGSIYGQQGANSGSSYGSRGTSGRQGKPQHHGGGLFGSLGSIGHWVGSKAALAGHDIEGIPGGIYQTAKAADPGMLAFRAGSDLVTGHPGRIPHELGNLASFQKEQFKGAYQTVKHPLRDPFATGMLVAPFLHAPLRIAEVARGSDIAEPRLLKMGDHEANLSPRSKGAFGRGVQRVYDKAAQRAIDRNPEGRMAAHINKRIGGQIEEAERPRRAMRVTKADQLERSGRKLSRQEQAALRLTSENIHPKEAAAFHESMAKEGLAPGRNKGWARIYRELDRKGVLTRDKQGNMIINAQKFPELAAIDKHLADAQRAGETIIHEHNLMTPEGQQERINQPVQQIRGHLSEDQRQGPLFAEGRGFLSEKRFEAKAPKTKVSRSGGEVIGEPRKPISAKSRTGAARMMGQIPDNTTRIAAQNLRGLLRYVNTHELRQRWLETGSDVRRTSRDILVRVPGTKAGELSPEDRALLGQGKLTTEELVAEHQGVQNFLDHILGRFDPKANPELYGIGEKAPDGYKWVDRNIIGDHGNSFAASRGRPGRYFDNLNSAITAATVYYKIGHIGTRLLTNAVTNIIQGSARPEEIARSFKLFKSLSEEDRRRAWAAAGQHGFEAMPHEGTGRLGAIATKGAQFWSHRADAMFRFNSIAYEARKAGFKTPAQFRGFLDTLEHPDRPGVSAEERARVENVAKSANREAIAYDRMSDKERRFIGRAFWFYPWVKASTIFTARLPFEHPYKAGFLGAMGVEGRKQQEKMLGPVPSYEYGLLPLGKPDAQGNVNTTNFSTFSPFSTAGSLLELPEYEAAAGNLNPAAAALLGLLTRTNQYGQHSNAPISDAITALLAASPEFQIGKAVSGKHKSKMFPSNNSPLAQLERMLVGPSFPRKANKADLSKAQGLEQAGR